MAIVSRTTLKNWFKQFAKPTESQFSDFFDSFIHKTEDGNAIGLDTHKTHILYPTGAIITRDGELLKAKENQQGVFDLEKWEPVQSLGTPYLVEKGIIKENHKMIIYGELTIEDELTIEGDLIILDESKLY